MRHDAASYGNIFVAYLDAFFVPALVAESIIVRGNLSVHTGERLCPLIGGRAAEWSISRHTRRA